MDKALLVGIDLISDQYYIKSNLDELEQLALTLDIKTKDKVVQKTDTISPKYYIGSGKVEELKKIITILDIDIVIFDDPLSPTQLLNLEKALAVQVIDRSFLILSIFAERAHTKQSILEVALAQKLYMLPRLIGLGNSLSRQGGGSYNAKGPGETKLELDRRKLVSEISQIKRSLLKIRKEKTIANKKRKTSGIPVVALIGYTNAGKSSLMNHLSSYLGSTQEPVLEKNMLFATLDTKARKLQKDNYPPFILIDTVGFISKLPNELIASFESTLSDVLDADLLIHVVDSTSDYMNQIIVTKQVLSAIKADQIDRILVFTKKDIAYHNPQVQEDYLFISNTTSENYDELISSIYGHLYKNSQIVTLKIPFIEGQIYSKLKDSATILQSQYLDDGILIRAILSPEQLSLYGDYKQ